MLEAYKTVQGTGGHSNQATAAADVLTADVSDMENLTVHAVQINDAGTTTQAVQYTLDGTNWLTAGSSITEASYPAGANQCVERTLSDSNGMPQRVKQVRLNTTALSGGGIYELHVGGSKVMS